MVIPSLFQALLIAGTSSRRKKHLATETANQKQEGTQSENIPTFRGMKGQGESILFILESMHH